MTVERMERIPTVASLMTPFPYSIDIDESLDAAKRMMLAHRFHHLPVKHEGRLVGVVSARHLELVQNSFPSDEGRSALRVRDACVLNTYTVQLTEPVDAVLSHMAGKQLGSALVVKGEKLVGIFTVTDACRHFAELLRSLVPPKGEGDAA